MFFPDDFERMDALSDLVRRWIHRRQERRHPSVSVPGLEGQNGAVPQVLAR